MKYVRALVYGLSFMLSSLTAYADEAPTTRVTLHIQPQPVRAALKEFSDQSGVQVLLRVDNISVEGVMSPRINGELTVQAALNQLLRSTGLKYEFINPHTVRISSAVPTAVAGETDPPDNSDTNTNERGKKSTRDLRVAQVEQGQTSSASSVEQPVEQTSKEKEKKTEGLQEIVVTGTHIHGADIVGSPPMLTYTREDIQNGGFATAQDLFEALPQNYHAINTDGQYATGTLGFASANLQSASLIDLYGLGPESTLVLFNGMRQAGVIDGRGVDISVIPLSILQQVDVATGGRSAIYGSDAVAGVVNFVTRHDFEGAETQATYGGTANGADHLQLSQVVGMKTDQGGFVAGYDFSKQDLFNLVGAGLTGTSIYGVTPIQYSSQPDKQTQSAYLAAHYLVVSSVDVYADALFTHDYTHNPKAFDFSGTLATDDTRTNSDQYNVSAGLRAALARDWKFNLSGNYSATSTDINDLVVEGGILNPTFYQPKATVGTASAVADGPVVRVNGNDLKVALGADWRRETNAPGDLQYSGRLSRNVSAVFLEGNLPLIEHGPPGMQSLELSGALRYDHYSDFGGTFNKQFGALWAPLDLLAVRSSYATSFHAPDLYTEGALSTAQILIESDPRSSSGSSPLVYWGGGNLNLKPETAETWTAGLDFLPPIPPAATAKFSVDYVDIRYTSRIAQPASSVVFGEELSSPILTPYINRIPSAALLAYIQSITLGGIQNNTGLPWDPATQTALQAFPNLVLLDDRFTNIATETVHFLDFKGDLRFDTVFGKLSAGFNGLWTLSHRAQNIAGTPSYSLMNDVGEPVGFRIRTNTGLERGPLSLFAYVNYTRSYPDTYSTPSSTMASWTTVDMSLRYNGSAIAKTGLLHGFEAQFSADNILNRKPPLFPDASFGMLYDPANANPFGRILSLRLLKHW